MTDYRALAECRTASILRFRNRAQAEAALDAAERRLMRWCHRSEKGYARRRVTWARLAIIAYCKLGDV